MSKIKIVTITTLTEGGAGIAALRLHLSLLDSTEVTSTLIQKNPIYDPSDAEIGIERCVPSFGTIYKILCKLKLTPKLTTEGRYLKAKSRYPNNYEEISIPVSYYRIEDHPLVKEADIIHLHWVSSFVDYTTFFKNVKQPIVWTLHDMNPFKGLFHYEEDEIDNAISFGKLNEKTIKLKTKSVHLHDDIHVVSPSRWLMDKSKKSEVLGRYPHSVIPNGIDFARYPEKIDKDAAKAQLGIDEKEITFFFIANNINVKRKGLDLILKTFENIQNHKLNLITLGSGEIVIENKNITIHHFKHTSDRSQINSLYTAADYTILPSREDNLPNVMLESFANGTPVISFKNGGMAEHIVDGINGFLVNEINHIELTKTIKNILNNKYIFNPEAIKSYAKETFDHRMVRDRHIQLYKSILKKDK